MVRGSKKLFFFSNSLFFINNVKAKKVGCCKKYSNKNIDKDNKEITSDQNNNTEKSEEHKNDEKPEQPRENEKPLTEDQDKKRLDEENRKNKELENEKNKFTQEVSGLRSVLTLLNKKYYGIETNVTFDDNIITNCTYEKLQLLIMK